MYVPYGDPAPTHRFKNVFDQGEYGIGWLANPLTLGCDCVGHIQYFDGVVNDNDGAPVVIPNAVCMHEEDAGIAWKHTDFRTGAVQVRRRRRLVVSSIVTVGNYEYGYFWYLYTDGTIEYEVKLTGVISTGAIAPGETPEHGTLVAPGLYGPAPPALLLRAPGHGRRRRGEPGGRGRLAAQRPRAGQPARQRVGDRAHRAGQRGDRAAQHRAAAGAVLEGGERREDLRAGAADGVRAGPGRQRAADVQQGRPVRAAGGVHRAPALGDGLRPRERFAAGDYPNQHPGGQGLPTYGAGDRPLDGEDVVVWYTFGTHHVVRPEDWPVMPVGHIGFMLKPSGFFDGNPALDTPPSAAGGGHCHSG